MYSNIILNNFLICLYYCKQADRDSSLRGQNNYDTVKNLNIFKFSSIHAMSVLEQLMALAIKKLYFCTLCWNKIKFNTYFRFNYFHP